MNLTLDSLHELVATLPDPVFILTESGRYAAVFGGTDENYYHNGSHLVGKNLHDVLPQEATEGFLAQISKCLDENCLITFEYGLSGSDVEGVDDTRGPDGQIWFDGRITPLSALVDGERAVLWVARNITERYILEDKLRQTSETDPLTGVYNRRRFVTELRKRFSEFKRYARYAALILLDIDFFKQVNDRYGHQVGDEVLCRLCALCRKELREPDILARFGGEEFIILLPSTSIEQAVTTAERLRACVEHCAEIRGISISVGISTFDPADSSEDAIISRADEAMYRAKRNGRNRVDVYQTA